VPAEVDGIGADVYEALERESATGRAGQLVTVPTTSGDGPVERVLLVGVGDGSPAMYRRAGAAVARAARGVDRLASTVTAMASDAELRAFVEGVLLAPYALRRPSDAKAPRTPRGSRNALGRSALRPV